MLIHRKWNSIVFYGSVAVRYGIGAIHTHTHIRMWPRSHDEKCTFRLLVGWWSRCQKLNWKQFGIILQMFKRLPFICRQRICYCSVPPTECNKCHSPVRPFAIRYSYASVRAMDVNAFMCRLLSTLWRKSQLLTCAYESTIGLCVGRAIHSCTDGLPALQ